jgi:hypothetical protein
MQEITLSLYFAGYDGRQLRRETPPNLKKQRLLDGTAGCGLLPGRMFSMPDSDQVFGGVFA